LKLFYFPTVILQQNHLSLNMPHTARRTRKHLGGRRTTKKAALAALSLLPASALVRLLYNYKQGSHDGPSTLRTDEQQQRPHDGPSTLSPLEQQPRTHDGPSTLSEADKRRAIQFVASLPIHKINHNPYIYSNRTTAEKIYRATVLEDITNKSQAKEGSQPFAGVIAAYHFSPNSERPTDLRTTSIRDLPDAAEHLILFNPGTGITLNQDAVNQMMDNASCKLFELFAIKTTLHTDNILALGNDTEKPVRIVSGMAHASGRKLISGWGLILTWMKTNKKNERV
jgi:hypothetical protein